MKTAAQLQSEYLSNLFPIYRYYGEGYPAAQSFTINSEIFRSDNGDESAANQNGQIDLYGRNHCIISVLASPTTITTLTTGIIYFYGSNLQSPPSKIGDMATIEQVTFNNEFSVNSSGGYYNKFTVPTRYWGFSISIAAGSNFVPLIMATFTQGK